MLLLYRIKTASLPKLICFWVDTGEFELVIFLELKECGFIEHEADGAERVGVSGSCSFYEGRERQNFSVTDDMSVAFAFMVPLALEGARGGEALIEDVSGRDVLTWLGWVLEVDFDWCPDVTGAVHVATAVDKKIFKAKPLELTRDKIDEVAFTKAAWVDAATDERYFFILDGEIKNWAAGHFFFRAFFGREGISCVVAAGYLQMGGKEVEGLVTAEIE